MRMVAVGASLVLLVGFCTDAMGKEFRVHTCNTPDGRPTGRTIASVPLPSGWTYESSFGMSAIVRDGCPDGEGRASLLVRGGTVGAGSAATMRWSPASGTSLLAVTASLVAYADNTPNRGQGTLRLTVGSNDQILAAANSPAELAYGVSTLPTLRASLPGASSFAIAVTCLDQCTPTAADLQLLSASFDVDDPSAPVGGLVGSGADAQVWSGVVRLRLNAVDEGSGLYRAVVVVDGADALVVPLGDGTCRDIGSDPAVNEFAAARPCPLRIDDGALHVDSAALPQGRHEVRVALEDAAGNRTMIFGPVVRMIAANGAIGPGSDLSLRGAANGEGASDDARLTAHWGRRGARTRLVSRFGRSHVVRGRLRTADGTPVARAVLDVISRTTAVDARTLAKRNGPVTGADGRWSLVLPRNVSSRDVTFRYRSHVGDTIPTATASVRLRVRAGLRLAIHPRVARRGQTIRFAGRLLGGPLPRGGKQIVLVARARGGPWLRFNVVRTGTHGRFRATYRFQQPGAVRYRFRALSRAEAAYPYLAGGSNVVRVLKR